MQGGGTWLGVSRSGRLAALTNYRSTEPQRADAPSRGELVAAFGVSMSLAELYRFQRNLRIGTAVAAVTAILACRFTPSVAAW